MRQRKIDSENARANNSQAYMTEASEWRSYAEVTNPTQNDSESNQITDPLAQLVGVDGGEVATEVLEEAAPVIDQLTWLLELARARK